MGRGLEVKALAEFSPGPNTNVLELRDLTLSSGKERKWEKGKRGRKGKEKVKEKENGEVKWKLDFKLFWRTWPYWNQLNPQAETDVESAFSISKNISKDEASL